MPRFFHLTRNKTKKRKKKKFSILYRFKIKNARLVIYAGLAILFLAYLVQVNSLATKGYIISELEQDLENLEKQNSTLEDKLLSLQTTENIINKIGDLNLVAASEVEYINSEKEIVAFK